MSEEVGQRRCGSLNDSATVTGMNAVTPEQAHDEIMLTLWGALYTAEARLDTVRSWWRSLSAPRTRNGGYDRDPRTWTEVVADFEVAEAAAQSWEVETFVRYRKHLTEAIDAQLAAAQALNIHEQSYTGWQRYFLVTSSAGLVHASTRCHTCNKGRSATQFALLPSLSGRSHEALVEALGPSLCSVCWPDAPVAWTDEQRISPNVATVLATEGEEAFWKALAASRAASAKRAATKARNDAELAARRAARAAAQS